MSDKLHVCRECKHCVASFRRYPDLDACELFNTYCSIARKPTKPLEHFETCNIIADWPCDIKYFCEALIVGPGTRVNTPPLSFEIKVPTIRYIQRRLRPA